MKKVIVIIVLSFLLAFSLMAEASFSFGANITYKPWDLHLSNTENFKSKDNFRFGFSLNVKPLRFLEISADTDFVSLDPFFKSETLMSVNIVLPLKRFSIGYGMGITFEISQATNDSQFYFTMGGINPKNLSYVFEHQHDSFTNAVRNRFFISYDFTDAFGIKAIYTSHPGQVGRYTNPDWVIKEMLDCGCCTVSLLYKP